MTNDPLDARATVTHSELAGILADLDAPEAEAAWAQEHDRVKGWKEEVENANRSLLAVANSRLERLTRVFSLSPEELALLKLCAAVAFDPSLSRACAYLQDHSARTYVTEDLASRLLELGRTSVWSPEMNVFRWELIHRSSVGPGEPHALSCDPQVRDWLLARLTLDEILVEAAKAIEPRFRDLPEWPVEEIAMWIDNSLRNHERPRLRVIVVAPQGGGKRTFAAAVARNIGMPLLILDADMVDDAGWNRFFIHAQRQAFLDSAALAWTGESITRRSWPANQALFPLQFVLCDPGSEPRPVQGAIDRSVRLPMPGATTREQLWRQSSSDAANWPSEELRKLAEHHRVWPGDIQHASALGARDPSAAAALVRESARSRFGNLVQILETPFTSDDLVLPEGVKQLLEAIAFEAEARAAFWRQPEALRLFPQGRGLVALFSGASGTGKTMAAQVIAGRLCQDLCRINVAQLVSKWVGETPKNVEQVVRVAAENNVVLFFDEADALFAKRTAEVRDAQDRFANTDTAFLLQSIESYPGIAILATNLKSNIDHAFLRRLRYLVEFPKPDAGLQFVLWHKLVRALSGDERAAALKSALELLSSSTEATGAQIKFAVLAGLFAARAEGTPLNVRHLLIGFDRELAKEGRGIGPRDRDRILKADGS